MEYYFGVQNQKSKIKNNSIFNNKNNSIPIVLGLDHGSKHFSVPLLIEDFLLIPSM
jgi:hypothetical protein